ncbi:MAG: hypothetical protein ACLPLP_28560 [Mycobacterium sp.]
MRVGDARRILRSIQDGDLETTDDWEPWDVDNGLLDPDAGVFDDPDDSSLDGDDLDDLFGDDEGDPDDDSDSGDDEDYENDLDDLGLTEAPNLVPDYIDGAFQADPSGKLKPDWVGRSQRLTNLADDVHKRFGVVTPREVEIRRDLAAVQAREYRAATDDASYCALCGDEHTHPETTPEACAESRPYGAPGLEYR